MIIPIDEKHRIDTDEHSWRVCTRRKRKAGDTWEPVSYHRTITLAVQSLADRMLRASDAVGLAEALVEVDNVTAVLSRALSPRFEVTTAGEVHDD